ncbi:MAG: ATP-binding cassette domain-containing protein [Candidatus Methanoperedens sp.]|nr:ATP-binding cassette domain-containing protein [Candidatus Methanoperedens sp.]
MIEAEALEKRYGGFIAVDKISFKVKEGEVFGFLGPNGAGKTTTMKMIQCVSPKDFGKLEVFGMDVSTDQRKIKGLLGVMPQENNLDPDFSVYQNLLIYSRYFNIPQRKAENIIEELLDFVMLNEKKDTLTTLLSGGMKRRLLLARALLNNPRLLVLDEPTVGMDPQARHLIWDKVKKLRSQGNTIVLSTHYLEEAQRLCDRLVIMDNGKILVEGKPLELIKEYIGTEIVEAENNPAALSCLEKTSSKFEVVGDTIHVYTDEPQRVMNALLKECDFGKVIVRRATLEDVFLKFTGRKMRD